MRIRGKIGGLAVVVMAGLLASGCTATTSNGSPSASTPTTTATASLPAAAPSPAGLLSVSRDDLTHLTPTTWSSPEAVSATRIRVTYSAGSPACYGVNARALESSTQVRIAVSQGLVPDGPAACDAKAYRATVVVELKDPLGDRTLTGQDG